MKVFSLVFLALFAAVQARSTALQARTEGSPWVVHIRLAVSTSGLLDSCVGSIINNRWVLTSATCVEDARFIWLRYAASNVIRPELVTETTIVHLNPQYNSPTGSNNVALININRNVEFTPTISPVTLAGRDDEVPSSATLCRYGATEDNTAGEELICSLWCLANDGDGRLVGISDDDSVATEFDFGAPLVSNGVQYGLFSRNTPQESVFVRIADVKDWIETTIA